MGLRQPRKILKNVAQTYFIPIDAALRTSLTGNPMSLVHK